MTVMELKGQTFESDLTNEEAIHVMAENVDSSFAASLFTQYIKRGDLSPKQWPWVHYLCFVYFNPPQKSKIVLETDWSKLIVFFDNAVKRGLKWPKIRFDIEGKPVVLSRAGDRSKYPGSINITDGRRFNDNIWYGRIIKTDDEVDYQPSHQASDTVLSFLQDFANDPIRISSEYGKKTGNCCFCAKKLSTEDSVFTGYGKVCSNKYGLPYPFRWE